MESVSPLSHVLMIGMQMDEMTTGPPLNERLAELLDPREEILEAYLFGSQRAGRRSPTATSMSPCTSTKAGPTTPATATGRT